MANTKSQRERERRAARDQAARRAAEKADRRRRIIAIGACGVVLLAVLGTVIAATNAGNDSTSATTTTSSLPGDEPVTTTVPGPTVETPAASPGATINGPTPCPAEDGSSPRTTQFSGPPPQCSDPNVIYDAVINTSVGELKVFLNSELAPAAVNNFIVLARYHYYDGAPLTEIISRTTMLVGADSTSGDPPASPGYTLPGEHTAQGTIFPLGTLLMQKVPGGSDRYAGNFMLALGEKAADLPPDVTNFGLLLAGDDTLRAIDRAGTELGGPTQLITITSVTIELAPVTSTTTSG